MLNLKLASSDPNPGLWKAYFGRDLMPTGWLDIALEAAPEYVHDRSEGTLSTY